LAIPLAISGRNGSGTSATGAGALRCDRRSSAIPPSNGRRPVTHSKNTQVAAYTSVTGVTGSDRHCSGAI